MCAAPARAVDFSSSFVNQAVTNFDLNAQGYADWARFSGSTTAEVEMPGATIIDSNLVRFSPAGVQTFNSAHTFVQGADNDNMTTAISSSLGSPPSLTATFNLEANTEYSVEIFTRVVVTASRDRNDILVTATIGEVTDTFVIDDEIYTASGGAGIYKLEVSGLTSNETLTIELAGLPDASTITSSAGFNVRLGAIGVSALGPPDTTPPALVLPTSPANGATGVPVVSNLVATFDEPIALEDGGTITIDNLGGDSDTVIVLPDARVSAVGADLVIDPDSPLAAGANYAVLISSDAVKDLASTANFFAGISDTATWSFQTNADGTGPVIVPPTTPADDAADIATNTQLVALFDEPILAGAGNITIRNLTGGTETIIPVGDPQVQISGSTLTIVPPTDLAPGADHAIRIDAGALTDSLGNPFAGIDDDTTWNFTTAADTIPPSIVSLTPANEGAIRSTGVLVATFSEEITLPVPTVLLSEDFEDGNGGFSVLTAAGSDWEYGTPDSFSPGGTIDSGNGAASGEGNCWGTKLGTYAGGSGDPGYYDSVLVPETITCLRSEPIDLTTASSAQLSFAQAYDLASGDTAVVKLIDEATGTEISGGPVFTAATGSSDWVNSPVIDLENGLGKVVRIEWCLTGDGGSSDDYLGWYIDDVLITATTGGTGAITLKNLSQGTETVYDISSPEVLISGNTLTITPAAALVQGDDYAVQIGSDVVTDLSGNFFPGILDDTTWNFTAAYTVSLTVVADTYIRTGFGPQDNDPDDELIVGSFSGSTAARALLRFDTSSLGALGDIDLVGATLVGTNRSDQNGAGGAMSLSAHEYGFNFVEESASWTDPDGDGSGATGDTAAGGTPGTLVATASSHGTGVNAVARFVAQPSFVTLIEAAVAGDNTINLLVKQSTEVNANQYARFSDRDRPDPFRLEIDYLGGSGPVGNSYANWIGGFPGVNGQIGLNEDPDGDGVSNGVENFFGTNPGGFSQGLLATAVDPGAGTFTFTHPQGTLADDLTAAYLWSTDLATFQGSGESSGGTTVTFTNQPNTPAEGFTTVTATVTGTPVDKLFVTVEVSQN